MRIAEGIEYVGVNDHELDLFEGQYIVPDGMAYNSYVIKDERTVVMDSVDARFADEWLGNIERVLDGAAPDYIVVQHMEPDHSGSLERFVETYPEVTVVASAVAFRMMVQFFGAALTDRQLVVKNGDTLDLGGRSLSFVAAKMVHWPEVIMTYDASTQTIFSADAFGKFGALDVEQDWACEARRYYFGIVGEYGAQVQKVLGAVSELPIKAICPLHGPVLNENLDYYIDLYRTWSSYGVESEGICICYTSVYGHTKEAVELLAAKLRDAGCPKVAVTDLARDDMAEAMEDAFRYGTLVLASTTYNKGVFPFMHTFCNMLAEHRFQKRRIGLIENGSWAPKAASVMKDLLAECSELTFLEPVVTITGGLSDASMAQLSQLADALME